MKTLTILLTTLGVAAALPTVATAAPWQSINSRQAKVDARIDQGIRNGSITRAESASLRRDFRNLVALEGRYRASKGLSTLERADLTRRYDQLSARTFIDKHDMQKRHR